MSKRSRLRPEAWLGIGTAVAALVYDPGATAASPKRAAGLLLVLAILSLRIADRWSHPKRPPLAVRMSYGAVFFAAFVAWSGMTLMSGPPSGTRDLGTFAGALGLIVVTQTWPSQRTRGAATWAGMLAGGGASVVAVVQWLMGARGVAVHGGQGNANWFGLLIAVTLPLTVGWILARRSPRAVQWSLPIVAIELAGLVLSHSRVAEVACVLSSCAVGLFVLRHRLGRWRLGLAGCLLGVVLALGATTLWPAAAPVKRERGADVAVPVAFEGRRFIWETSLLAALHELPMGAGLGGFSRGYLEAQGQRLKGLSPKAASHRFINATTAHSDWIEPLVDSGPMALLLLVLSLGTGVVTAALTRWHAGMGALLAWSLCAVGDSPLRQPGITLILGLVLAGCPAPRTLDMGRLREGRSLARMQIAFLAATGLLLWASTRTWIGERRLAASPRLAPDRQQALLASAARLDPTSGEIALERGLRALDLGQATLALTELQRSRRLLANVGTDIAIGNAQMLLGHPTAAVQSYRKALSQNPGSFRAHANLSQALLSVDDPEGAARELAIARDLWPGHPRLIEMGDRVKRALVDRETQAAAESPIVEP